MTWNPLRKESKPAPMSTVPAPAYQPLPAPLPPMALPDPPAMPPASLYQRRANTRRDVQAEMGEMGQQVLHRPAPPLQGLRLATDDAQVMM